MKSTTTPAVDLPVGYHRFHRGPLLNDQPDRLHSPGGGGYGSPAAAGVLAIRFRGNH